MELPLAIDVECYAGYRGEETPRRFGLAATNIEIAEVVDRWLAPDHRYFKVRDDEGDIYILRNDVASRRWELTFFQRAAPMIGGAESGGVSPLRSVPTL